MLRDGLLEDRAVAVVGASEEICRSLRGLGARVEPLEPGGIPEAEEEVGSWARARAPLTGLVCDAGGLGEAGLTEWLASCWAVVREVALGALIPGRQPAKVLLLAPREGRHAAAVSAALESLSRTLSIEWARFGVTAVLLAPVPGAAEAELAELVAFLCSRAGDYFSGCRIDVGPAGPGSAG
jgi:hypothetical protein